MNDPIFYYPPEGGGVLSELPEPEETQPVDWESPRVLVIEEDVNTRLMLCALLRSWNNFALGASPYDIRAILPLAPAFSLIILNVQESVDTGYGVLTLLSMVEGRPPVIVLSTSARHRLLLDPDLVKVVIRKPFEIQHLRECVASLVNRVPVEHS